MSKTDIVKKFLEFLLIQFIAYPLGGYLSVKMVGDNTSVWPTMIAGSFTFAVLMTAYFTAREYNNKRAATVVFIVLFIFFVLTLCGPLLI